jgi:hypothetical protein
LANFEVRLLEPAEAFLRALEPERQAAVGRLLDLLEIDPWVDGIHKILVPIPPVSFPCYIGSEYWILYHIVQNTVVSVLNIDFADESVTPWRD